MICKECNSEMNVEKMKSAFYNGKWSPSEYQYACTHCGLVIKVVSGKYENTYVVKEIIKK